MIGKRIKKMREYLGYTQQEVADYLKLHRPSITEIEKGSRKVSSEELTKFCTLFKVPPDYLLHGQVERMSQELHDLIFKSDIGPEDMRELKMFAEYLKMRKKQREHINGKVD